MKILDRIKRAIARSGSSAGPAVSGGAASTPLAFGQVEAVEREEFPPEEFSGEELEDRE